MHMGKVLTAAIISMALLLTVILTGCSDKGVDPADNASGFVSLKLTSPDAVQAAQYVIITIIPLDRPNAPPIPPDTIVLGANSLSFRHEIPGVPAGRTQVIVEILDENYGLLRSGETIVMVIADMRSRAEVTLTEPTDVIDNDVVHIHFDRAHACIDSLIYRQGSNVNLIDDARNDADNMYGLGGLKGLEGNVRLSRFQVGPSSATVAYTASYGTKTLRLRWSRASGLEIDIELNLHVDLPVWIGNAWKPGGDLENDGSDWFGAWADLPGKDSAFWRPLDTPSTYADRVFAAGLAEGNPDSVIGEVIGYRYLPGSSLIEFDYNDTSIVGPLVLLGSAGRHVIEFAAKRDSAFVIWLSADAP